MMMKIFVVLATIAIFTFSIASSSVIRDQDNFLLGNERISKRSIDDNKTPVVEAVEATESTTDSNPDAVQLHIINTRSIRSDEYRQHDDLLMSIVPKAIFGERFLKRFVEDNVLRGMGTPNHNLDFKPQFRLRASSIEKRLI